MIMMKAPNFFCPLGSAQTRPRSKFQTVKDSKKELRFWKRKVKNEKECF